ncbi:MAG: hypothetical protein HXX08_24310 [Chloroflexi bacterium]|uniref:LSDAT prokaryote domain-containing protein n=1 Tax=Candidatus Chlorohelix allophototropha TaxID=3003348 RepID=A0A8T7MA35_9CHLR|nr:hypothetical protein [Chloroflexota bacterium]WJW68926.1 hypothetical protein OZ401_004548 [Chloroflexota bacterium L227-S17]
MPEVFSISFENKATALAIHATHLDNLKEYLRQLGLNSPAPVIVLVGGAGKMESEQYEIQKRFFAEVLVELAEQVGAIVIDGATDAGVIRLMGNARAARNASFPLLGVVPEKLVYIPGTIRPENTTDLEQNHTHFLLIPGSNWGDEIPWMSQAASLISATLPSLTILINGGEVAYRDVAQSVEAGRKVAVVQGSGRTADVLGKTIEGEQLEERATKLVQSGLLFKVNLYDNSSVVLQQLLSHYNQEQ